VMIGPNGARRLGTRAHDVYVSEVG
jgi:hypothetical protein